VWTPVRTADGSWTLRHGGHGEACHSLSGAWRQARERYAIPCRIRELALERGVVRLLDVGTGLGLDLAAAVDALRGTQARLEATTLEIDCEVVTASLALVDWPEDVERSLAPIREALRESLAGAEVVHAAAGDVRVTLRARFGDARESIRKVAGPFDAVFLDPFSPGVDGALWQADFLGELAARMDPDAVLSTYSAALEVRANLARAGLRVGLGPRVGTKAEGTLASFAAPLLPFTPRTSRKLARRLRASATEMSEKPAGGRGAGGPIY
jgi:tRNA U34 5-methylaminomethyl-2-thiouridine-forming methyltransferase MnmC